ncbi:MAG: hypothetical protein HXY34_05185 [Candidatus Thorarchaeota archaeon]|nr:hypothetical protein [Candidatus Thorarchaeota archaeon]
MFNLVSHEEAVAVYRQRLSEGPRLKPIHYVMGFGFSAALMGVTTFDLMLYVNVVLDLGLMLSQIESYTLLMLFVWAAVCPLSVCVMYLVRQRPSVISLLLRVHRFLKRGTGEYFLCPEPGGSDLRQVLRRSLYGSVLVSGIALTVLSFQLIVPSSSEQVMTFGAAVMVVSFIVLPLTLMEFYFGPWLFKDAGLFHLDSRDRSLSNVGDDLEDMLEFFAGIDILLVWLEITLNTSTWVALLIIAIVLGPLFAIIINFTLVFTMIERDAVTSMISSIMTDHQMADIVRDPEGIRKRVLALIDKRMVMPAGESDAREDCHLSETAVS